jgi:hypothetical protein
MVTSHRVTRSATSDGGDMTQSENKALVARYFEQVLTRGDVAALDDLLAPDFRSTAIHIHRVAGGKLAEHWEAINLLSLLQQLGVAG